MALFDVHPPRPRPLFSLRPDPRRPTGVARPLLAATLLILLTAEALAESVAEPSPESVAESLADPAEGGADADWAELALTRCAQAMIDHQAPDAAELTPLDAAEALRVDIRSAGAGWEGASGQVRLAHMQHQADGRDYVGCRVDFTPLADPLAPAPVPIDVPAAIAAFQTWLEGAREQHAFIVMSCPSSPRAYAIKAKTRDLVPQDVQVSVVFEVGLDGAFVFFAAVEEPPGQGECLD